MSWILFFTELVKNKIILCWSVYVEWTFPMLHLPCLGTPLKSPSCVIQTTQPCGKIIKHCQKQFPDSLIFQMSIRRILWWICWIPLIKREITEQKQIKSYTLGFVVVVCV